MNTYVQRFRSVILDSPRVDPNDDCLLIERHGRLACHYAPFDHINQGAKVVLMGITPGAQQAGNALAALRAALLSGTSDSEALQLAKQTASFSGSMRSNLVAMLDRIGLPKVLGIDTCARLFDTRADLAHFTSALRYPVFVDGKDYSGSPSILATPTLRDLSLRWLRAEVDQLRNAFWVPLGKEPAAVLAACVARGELDADRVLAGLPHPSGANSERIAYFLGNKERHELSVKTNPALIDSVRARLIAAIHAASHHVAHTAIATTTSPVDLAQTASVSAPTEPSQPRAMKMDETANARPASGPTSKVTDTGSRLATSFHLVGHMDEPIWPIRMKNQVTGCIAFVLAPRGAGTHKREHAIEVDDEARAYEMVRSGTFKIRATRDPKAAAGLLGLGDRAVKGIVRT